MIEQDNSIPIFPLQTVVLFPMVSVPLYIFEPRYRQMISDTLEGQRRVGMVTAVPGPNLDMLGNPQVFDVGCEGEIAAAEQQEDGTYKILLEATQRFRILHETPPNGDQLYRTAQIEPLTEQFTQDHSEELHASRQTLIDQLRELNPDKASSDNPLETSLERISQIEDDHFINILSQSIDFGVLEKQKLLEANGPLLRSEVLSGLLRFQLAAEAHAPLGGPRTPQ